MKRIFFMLLLAIITTLCFTGCFKTNNTTVANQTSVSTSVPVAANQLFGIWADFDDIFEYDGYSIAVFMELFDDGTGTFWEGKTIPIRWSAENNRLTLRYNPETSEWIDIIGYDITAEGMLNFWDEDGNIRAVYTKVGSAPIFGNAPANVLEQTWQQVPDQRPFCKTTTYTRRL